MMTDSDVSSLVIAVVGEDRTGVVVLTSPQEFFRADDGRRVFAGVIASRPADTDRVQKILGVYSGCASPDVHIVFAEDIMVLRDTTFRGAALALSNVLGGTEYEPHPITPTGV